MHRILRAPFILANKYIYKYIFVQNYDMMFVGYLKYTHFNEKYLLYI